ncbi:MAG: shikimate dehydrogenase [Pseudomonadota bacterium]
MSDPENTPFAEVIGDPIMQSKSPLIHGFWIKRLGIEARYGARRVTVETLPDYIETSRQNPKWLGCNITMPLKQAVIPLIDELEPIAEAIGAVNTVYRGDNGKLIGTNTDAGGFLEPLEDILKDQHLFRMARIIGNGGAARAIVAALAQRGFTLVLAARNVGKARSLLGEIATNGEHYTAPLAHFAEATDFDFDDREGCLDLIINASPLGMRGNPPLSFDWSHAPPGSIVYDIVTSPTETPFLMSAKEAGFQTVSGLGMLVGQAAIAFEKLFGQAPPRAFDEQLQDMLRV